MISLRRDKDNNINAIFISASPCIQSSSPNGYISPVLSQSVGASMRGGETEIISEIVISLRRTSYGRTVEPWLSLRRSFLTLVFWALLWLPDVWQCGESGTAGLTAGDSVAHGVSLVDDWHGVPLILSMSVGYMGIHLRPAELSPFQYRHRHRGHTVHSITHTVNQVSEKLARLYKP